MFLLKFNEACAEIIEVIIVYNSRNLNFRKEAEISLRFFEKFYNYSQNTKKIIKNNLIIY